jgi:tRNA threonylcarbamoyladenosine biosynthesis protein TsaE
MAVLYLQGNLGAGKTTLARGFLRACGVAGPVRSPTYTLLEIYEVPTVTVLHLDLYRLQQPDELESLGLREWARPGHVWLIEWPERGLGRLPPPDVSLSLAVAAVGHEIEATGHSVLGQQWLAAAVEKPWPSP